MAKSPKKAAEKELKVHMRDVKGARKELSKEASSLSRDIKKKITHALGQDRIIQKDVRKIKAKK